MAVEWNAVHRVRAVWCASQIFVICQTMAAMSAVGKDDVGAMRPGDAVSMQYVAWWHTMLWLVCSICSGVVVGARQRMSEMTFGILLCAAAAFANLAMDDCVFWSAHAGAFATYAAAFFNALLCAANIALFACLRSAQPDLVLGSNLAEFLRPRIKNPGVDIVPPV
ncbi:Transmembrane protein [Plasmodiophora brassicae]|nr:hypothetical protein PBRA_004653 [Plasmodiophora brassicae]